jgi:hypothetical protein
LRFREAAQKWYKRGVDQLRVSTVARVLSLVGADQLIPVYPSVEDAAAGTPRS